MIVKTGKGTLLPSDRNIFEHLILGAAPERRKDLETIWERYNPTFWCQEDTAGFKLYTKKTDIYCQSKTMQVSWLVGFIAWRALCLHIPHIFVHLATGEPLDTVLLKKDPELGGAEAAFEELLYYFKDLRTVTSVDDIGWPNGVPRVTDDRESLAVEEQATFDLVLIALAYAFLHEIRHAMFYIDKNAPSEPASEEMECDKFARDFIMTQAAQFAENAGVPVEQVLDKRATGIALGAFIVYEVSDESVRAGGYLYPPIADRFDTLVTQCGLPPGAIVWNYAATFLLTLVRRHNRAVLVTGKSSKEVCEFLIREVRQMHV